MPNARVLSLTRQAGQDAEAPLFQLLAPTLPTVRWVKETRRLLQPGPFADRRDLLAVHYAEGCGQGCPFCPERAGDEVRLVSQAPARLDAELATLEQLPRGVLLGAQTEPFPPLAEVQNTSAELVEVLARHGVDSCILTRGFIRPAALETLARHADRVRVTVALTTLDRTLQRALEPLAAPPRLRLKTIHRLRDAGIAVQAALEPLVPGVTDTRENLEPVLEALEEAGVTQVTVGYLILHPRQENDMLAALRPLGLDSLVADEYARGPLLGRARAPGRYLPRARRQHGYAAVMALAASHGIRVGINSLTNPDFNAGPRMATAR